MSRNYKFHNPEGLYSSATDYAGEQGLLKDVEVIEQVNVRF